MRTILSLGILGCVTLSLVPLGCGAQIRYPTQQEDRPRVPDATAERLRACVDEFGGDLPRGSFTFEYTVKVDEEGRVVDVESKGVPHADLAGCTRIALRGMTVPEELLRLPKLRLSASPAPANGQTPAERGLVGHPGALVAVAIALAELAIQVGPTLVVMAASLELSGDIAEAIQKRPRWEEQCNRELKECLGSPLQSKFGSVYNSRRCKWCREKCTKEDGWPEKIPIHDDKFETCAYSSDQRW